MLLRKSYLNKLSDSGVPKNFCSGRELNPLSMLKLLIKYLHEVSWITKKVISVLLEFKNIIKNYLKSR